jgi:hypothetical protein
MDQEEQMDKRCNIFIEFDRPFFISAKILNK